MCSLTVLALLIYNTLPDCVQGDLPAACREGGDKGERGDRGQASTLFLSSNTSSSSVISS